MVMYHGLKGLLKSADGTATPVTLRTLNRLTAVHDQSYVVDLAVKASRNGASNTGSTIGCINAKVVHQRYTAQHLPSSSPTS
jgi:hypothetical protein